MRVLAAASAAALLFAGVAFATRAGVVEPSGQGGRLPAPPVGSVSADVLPDGMPVFVVRNGPDEVSVLSAISPHLDNPVGYCTSSGWFMDVHGSRFDGRGRYAGGPAPASLTSYEARLDGGFVEVGARRQAAGRVGPEQPPAGPECLWEWVRPPMQLQGSASGPGELVHDFDVLYGAPAAPEAVRWRVGAAAVRLRARLHLDGPSALLCSPRLQPGCPPGAPAVISTFHRRGWMPFLRGWTDGEALARRLPDGFADVAMVGAGWSPELHLDLGEFEWSPAAVTGELRTVERNAGGWVAVLASDAEPVVIGTEKRFRGLPAGNRWSLHPDALILHDVRFLEPAELADHLARRGPLTVELQLTADGAAFAGEVLPDT